MKMNQHIVKTACPPGNSRLLRRAALPSVMLAVAVVFATGCSSTGALFNTRLISPVPAAQQSSDLEENGLNQSPRSPAFNDLFGG
jgi:hypothetical protein